jgi:hypothetical protein
LDYLYSLYDALISINVPGDKARAVVDAMERDMGTTLATKADLQILRTELRQEMGLLATKAEVSELRQDIAMVRKDMEVLATSLRRDQEGLAASFQKDQEGLAASFQKDQEGLAVSFQKAQDGLAASFQKDLQLLSTTMTVRLGSLIIAGTGVLFAALKLA